MKTYQPKSKEVVRKWHLIDAEGQILGRLSTNIATFLIGKHKARYSQHIDSGDYVVIVNAKKVKLSGRKNEQKQYIKHTGYPGGLKRVSFQKIISEQPSKVIEKAVSGMLPDNRLKSKRLARLKIFSDNNNPYQDKFN